MTFLKKLRFGKHISWSTIALVIILGTCIWHQLYAKRWNKEAIIQWDVLSYYAYLPAVFIYDDISLKFIDTDRDTYSKWFWPGVSAKKKYVIKTTMGMSMLYSQFFFIGHAYAKIFGYELSGFSSPYHASISFGALVYFLVGLVFLRKILLKYFTDLVASITLILITLGTNLWWYTTIDSGMSHVYSFTLFTLFIFFTEKWFDKSSIKNTIALGVLSGLITLVRPSNIIVGIVFLLWHVRSSSDLVLRLRLLASQYNLLIVMVLCAISIWLPQMLYWKMQAGSFFYNSYGEEGFFFLSPKIFDGFFSYRKGMFLYTPIMAIVFVGFIFLFKHFKSIFIPISIFTAINIYVIFSWWCWWYGGGYGARTVIDSYALLAFPLAAFVQWSLSRKIYLKIVLLSFMLLLFSHSIFQTFQYYFEAIHWDSMTKEAYWDSFARIKPSKEFKSLLVRPDYNAALRSEPEANQ